MSEETSNNPVEAAAEALKVAEDTVGIARRAEEEKEAALQKAKQAEEQLVELQKVASEQENAVDAICSFLAEEGYLAPDEQEKFASEMKNKPALGVDLFKRIVSFSASPYVEGEGIPKSASTDVIDIQDPDAALRAQEEAAWTRMAEEGA